MGFLTKHCQLSWQIAVHNCKLIFDGLTDLEQRKQFVSSLQNAIELCLKQYLIDNNDILVLHRDKMNSGTKLVIYNNCSTSTNYNSFFSGLTTSELNDVYSSAFTKIFDHIFTRIHPLTSSITSGFEILKDLRNKETHFYISEDNYLSIDEFKELCKLMRIMQKFFMDNNILERVDKETDEYHKKILGYFDEKLSKLSSYENLIKSSKTNVELLRQFPDFESKKESLGIPRGWMFYVDDIDDLYTISHEIYEHHGPNDPDLICFDFTMDFNEFYRRFCLWQKYGIVCLEIDVSEINGENVNAVFVFQSKKTTTYIRNI